MAVDSQLVRARVNYDSLDVVEFGMEVEDEFEIAVPDDQFDRLKTVGQVVRYIQEQRQPEKVLAEAT
jgi:acyl carrier protein